MDGPVKRKGTQEGQQHDTSLRILYIVDDSRADFSSSMKLVHHTGGQNLARSAAQFPLHLNEQALRQTTNVPQNNCWED
eukprot:3535284-Pleurochrysis_carterae.AAC.1